MLMIMTLAVLGLVEWEFFKVERHLKSQNQVLVSTSDIDCYV
jgi:hypothetical protein